MDQVICECDVDELIDSLNRECFCIGTDLDALRAWLERDLAAQGLSTAFVEAHPHLFSALPVFVSKRQIERMQEIVTAVETIVATPGYHASVLADAPAIAHHDPGNPGVLMGYDFHLSAAGPKLIEINTNAGGALLNAELVRAQRACCEEVEPLLSSCNGPSALESAVFEDFMTDWRMAGRTSVPECIAIVDDMPEQQYLFPEFLLFKRLFESNGIDAAVIDSKALRLVDRELRAGDRRIDFVYNRLTDFYFEGPAHAVLHRAFETGAAVISPHPRAHALYANKRNLVRLSDCVMLADWTADEQSITTLSAAVPTTQIVTAASAEALWRDRKAWFFKPARGFGSRGSYRGSKLTRKTFAAIVGDDYVAQALVPPSERWPGEADPLKVDFRAYVYRGEVRMIAARLYRGQTTNFRTPGGGFAPVFYPPDDTATPRPGGV